MALQISGRLHYVGNVESIPSKTGGEPFYKREFWLNTCEFDRETGEKTYGNNIVKLEASGDRCSLLNDLSEGDEVLVTFRVRGGLYTSKTTGNEECITRLDLAAIKVTKPLFNENNTAPSQHTNQVANVAPTAPNAAPLPQILTDQQSGNQYYIGSDGVGHWMNDLNPDGSYK